MTYVLSLRKEAESDVAAQFEYYESKREGLGHDFLLCVEEALAKLPKNPLIYREIYKGIRRVSVRRFPCRIFYFVQSNQIVVTAVFHIRKDPSSWSSRA